MYARQVVVWLRRELTRKTFLEYIVFIFFMEQENMFLFVLCYSFIRSPLVSHWYVLLESENNLTNWDISLNFNEVIKETHFQR